MQLKVRHIGVYREAQKSRYTTPACYISFNMQGLLSYRCPGFDLQRPDPFFLLSYPGMDVAFEYGEDRENWVISVDTGDIQPADTAGLCRVRTDNGWAELPVITWVAREQVPGWQTELARMHRAFQTPVPRNTLRVHSGILNILRYILDTQELPCDNSPASQLKDLIDKDESCQTSIESLSAQCGYSADHLRMLFRKQFQMPPLEYRNRRRMTRAMDLIANSARSIKEIAAATGFDHASHFSLLFKNTYGLTPREAVARLRK